MIDSIFAFGARPTLGGLLKSITTSSDIWFGTRVSPTFEMEGTAAEGGKVGRPDSATDLQVIAVISFGSTPGQTRDMNEEWRYLTRPPNNQSGRLSARHMDQPKQWTHFVG